MLLYSNRRISDAKETIRADVRAFRLELSGDIKAFQLQLSAEIRTVNLALSAKINKLSDKIDHLMEKHILEYHR